MIQQSKKSTASKNEIHRGSINPEKLNEVVKIISPPTLLFSLLSFGSIGGLIVWSIYGSLPQTVQAPAVFIPPETLTEIKAAGTGNVYFYDDLRPKLLKEVSRYNQTISSGLSDSSTLTDPSTFNRSTPLFLLGFVDFYSRATKLSISDPRALLRPSIDREIEDNFQNANLLDATIISAGVPFAYIFNTVTAASLEQAANTYRLSQSSVESQMEMNKEITSSSDEIVKQLMSQQRELIALEKQGIVPRTQVLSGKQELLNAFSQNMNSKLDLKRAKSQLVQNKVNFNTGLANAAQSIFIARPYNGIIIAKVVKSGNKAEAGQTIAFASYRRNLSDLDIITAFIPPEAAKCLRPGMDVLVNPTNVNTNQYGSIKGTLKDLSSVSIASDSAGAIVGYKSLTDEAFKRSGTMFIATIKLNAAKTPSGYQWNTSAGPDYRIPISTPANITIISDHIAPASLLLPFLRSFTGLK
jgi:HlyD family secretion protein